MLRGIRGATLSTGNTKAEIDACVEELLRLLLKENEIDISTIGAIIFSSTADLTASFPASCARKMGLKDVPLFSTTEPHVTGDLPFAIRILILLDTEKKQNALKHIYLHGAARLRPEYAFVKKK